MSYGAFIWASYVAALVCLGGLVVVSVTARRRVRRDLAARGLDKRR